MTVFSLFSGADLIGELDTREEAERVLDEAVSADPSAADERAAVEFDEKASALESRFMRAA